MFFEYHSRLETLGETSPQKSRNQYSLISDIN